MGNKSTRSLDDPGNQIYHRIRQAFGVSTQKEVAEHLGITRSNVSNAFRNQTVPKYWIPLTAQKTGVDAFWLEQGGEGVLFGVCSEPRTPMQVPADEWERGLARLVQALTGQEHTVIIDGLKRIGMDGATITIEVQPTRYYDTAQESRAGMKAAEKCGPYNRVIMSHRIARGKQFHRHEALDIGGEDEPDADE